MGLPLPLPLPLLLLLLLLLQERGLGAPVAAPDNPLLAVVGQL